MRSVGPNYWRLGRPGGACSWRSEWRGRAPGRPGALPAATRPGTRLKGFATAAATPGAPAERVFQVVPIEGKGLGLVAARPLRVGELILAERPALAYSSSGAGPSVAALEQALGEDYARLEPARQQEVMDLHDANAEPGSKTLAGIVYSNAFSRDPALAFDAALCVHSSRLNHSCRPNAEQTWDADLGEVQVRASTDIQAGEEICNYYIDLAAPREERQRALWDRYRFRCECPACAASEEALATSDKRRKRLRLLLRKIAPGAGGIQSAVTGIRHVEEILVLLGHERLSLLCQRKVVCRIAAELSHSVGKLRSARAWMEESYEACLKCNGPQHRDTQWLQRRLEEMNAPMRWSDIPALLKDILSAGKWTG